MDKPWIYFSSNNTNKYNPQEPYLGFPASLFRSNNTNKYNPQEPGQFTIYFISVQIIRINTILKNYFVR